MKNTTIALLGLLAVTSTAPAFAADSGFYLGGGIGAATLQDDPPNFDDIDESDAAGKYSPAIASADTFR